MTESDLPTADEAAKLPRISRRTFDGHVARGDITYIAVGLDGIATDSAAAGNEG
ncbi:MULTISPECIES: hypothetical protein [unclassified Methylobacterium]|uniref:hypothetical protein n=1 Tax=unclassified Methylobacterium TaxID=2615210 RepID=UPI00164FFE0D|nr:MULTISPECIES: hypothetical protein [unclassified Methylobacterium]